MNAPRVLLADLQPGMSGGQNQLLMLTRRLRGAGVDVQLLLREGGEAALRFAAEGFSVHAAQGRWNAIKAARRLIREHRIQLVHTHCPQSHLVANFAMLGTRRKVPLLVHRRIDFPVRDRALSRYRYARDPARLVAVSGSVRDVLIACGVPAEKIEVIHSGIDLEAPVDVADGTLRERLGIGPTTPLLLTLASAADYKDHPTLIRSAERIFARHDSVHWAVVGGGGMLEELRNTVQERGLSDRLHYLGFVAGGRSFLDEAVAFVLTSRHEGFCNSALEAMASGTPIVATRAGGMDEMIAATGSGLLADIGDDAAIAGHVLDLLENPALGERLAAAGHERVAQFSVDRTAEQTMALYRSMLG